MINGDKIDKIKKGKPFSPLDIIAILLSLCLCVVWIVALSAGKKQGEILIIKQSTEGIETRYKLSENQEIRLNLEKGEMVIKIEDGAAWVVVSPCRGQDCAHMPPIRYAGQSIICADCRVIITVDGQQNFTAIQ